MSGTIWLTGGEVLGPGGLEARDLGISGGVFAGDDAAGGSPRDRPGNGPGDRPGDRVVSVRGMWLLPGLVDLHGDGFERQLAPRRGVVGDLAQALLAVETDLAAAGITTAWLAQFWSWEGGMRGPDFARRLAEALGRARPALRLDLRLQLRFERTMLDDIDAVLDFVRGAGIGYVVFNDHVPHDRLAEGRKPPRLAGSAAKAGRAPDAHLAVMSALAARAGEVPGAMARMARALRQEGVALGSHDDADGAARALWGCLGAGIAEFPVTREAAEAARDRGDPVIMGAPNVVRGGSHNRGGLSAEALIAEGLVDALASDYHYPSLAAAALHLAERGVLPLAEAWRLVSDRPAEVMGLRDRGRIAPDRRADLVLYDPGAGRIVGTIAAGRPALAQGRFAEALLSG